MKTKQSRGFTLIELLVVIAIIAIQREIDGRDTHLIHLDPTELLQAGDELVLIGNIESEETFLKTYVSS